MKTDKDTVGTGKY